MTDEQIIKALECCSDYFDCDNCECKEYCPKNFEELFALALDLINRQKAEIKKWKENARGAFLINLNEEAKAEAVAFLIEKLIDMSVCKDNGDGTESLYVSVSNARQFLKEMVGENNG